MGVLRRIVLPVALGVLTVGAAVGAVAPRSGRGHGRCRRERRGRRHPGAVTPSTSRADHDAGRRSHPATPADRPAGRRAPRTAVSWWRPTAVRSWPTNPRSARRPGQHPQDPRRRPPSSRRWVPSTASPPRSGPARMNGNGVVQGDAWLVGGGDPQLSTDDYAATDEREEVARTSLEDLADAVAAAGVTRITGRLVADETRYDTARRVAELAARSTASPVLDRSSALSVNDGFSSFPTPADPSRPEGAVTGSAPIGGGDLGLPARRTGGGRGRRHRRRRRSRWRGRAGRNRVGPPRRARRPDAQLFGQPELPSCSSRSSASRWRARARPRPEPMPSARCWPGPGSTSAGRPSSTVRASPTPIS